MSKGDVLDVQKTYDATAAWLRDCVRTGHLLGVKHAEVRLKELEVQLAKTVGMPIGGEKA